MRKSIQIHPSLRRPLHERFKTYCAAKGVTESSVVEAALTDYLDGTGDATLLLKRLNRLGRSHERAQRDIEVLSEAFAVFVRIWSVHVPELADPSAPIVANKRYQAFLDTVRAQFTNGHRFVDDLVEEQVADPEELAHAAALGSESSHE
jgi:hypothetical protein